MTTPTSNQAGSSYQLRGSPTVDRYGRDLSTQLSTAARSAGTATTGISKFNEILGNTGRILRHALIPLSGVLVGLTTVGANLLKTAQSAGYTSEAFRQVNRDMYRAKLALSRIVVDAIVPLLQVMVKLINAFNSLPKGFKVTTLAVALFAIGVATALAPVLLLIGYSVPLIIALNKWGLAAKLTSIRTLALTVSMAPLQIQVLALTIKNWLLIKSHVVLHAVTNSTIIIQVYLALSTLRYSIAAGIAAVANSVLAASFVALKLAIGPVGLVLVAIGLAVYGLTKAWRAWQSSTDSQTSSIGKTLRLWGQSSLATPGALTLPLPEEPAETPWWRRKNWWFGNDEKLLGYDIVGVFEEILVSLKRVAGRFKPVVDENTGEIDWWQFFWGSAGPVAESVYVWLAGVAKGFKPQVDENTGEIDWWEFFWGSAGPVAESVYIWLVGVAKGFKPQVDENTGEIDWWEFFWGSAGSVAESVYTWLVGVAKGFKPQVDPNTGEINWWSFFWGSAGSVAESVYTWLVGVAKGFKPQVDPNTGEINWWAFFWGSAGSIAEGVYTWLVEIAKGFKPQVDPNTGEIDWWSFFWGSAGSVAEGIYTWLAEVAKGIKVLWDENVNPIDWAKFLWGNIKSTWTTVKKWLTDRIRSLNPLNNNDDSSDSPRAPSPRPPSSASGIYATAGMQHNYRPSASNYMGTGVHNLGIRPPAPLTVNVRQIIDGTKEPKEVGDLVVDKIREAIDSGRFAGRLEWA